jgi:hypothetical protein
MYIWLKYFVLLCNKGRRISCITNYNYNYRQCNASQILGYCFVDLYYSKVLIYVADDKIILKGVMEIEVSIWTRFICFIRVNMLCYWEHSNEYAASMKGLEFPVYLKAYKRLKDEFSSYNKLHIWWHFWTFYIPPFKAHWYHPFDIK